MKAQANKTKFIVSLFALLASASAIHAQSYLEAKRRTQRIYFTYAQHEASVYLMGGISNFMYSPIAGDKSLGLGFGGGAAYTYAIDETWNVSGGVELTVFNSSVKLGSFTDRTLYEYRDSAPNPVSEPYYYKRRYEGYTESQKAYYVRVPLMAMYNYFWTKDMSIIGLGGIKLGIPISGEYTAIADQMITSGDFPYSGHDGDNDLKNQLDNGWGTNIINGAESPGAVLPNVKKSLNFGFDLSIHLEGGLRWTLTEKTMLYATAYFGIGVLNVKPASAGEVLNLPSVGEHLEVPMANFGYNSVLTATKSNDNPYPNGTAYVQSVHPIEFGIKLRIAFALGNTRPMFFRKTAL